MKIVNSCDKLVVILGPTASGKTKLAVELAAKFDGEIISADSRQVYRGMDVGTGKDLGEYNYQLSIINFQLNSKASKSEASNKLIKIPYHLIDVAEPNEQFDLAAYKKMAEAAIADIIKRGKLPILVGGTGLYLQAVVDDYQLSTIGSNSELRTELEQLDTEQLYKRLEKANPAMAEKLNQSDRHNPRRLVRYLEIVAAGHKVTNQKKTKEKFDTLIIGLEWPMEKLYERIELRLKTRLENEDMEGEVMRLHREGVSWKRLESFGLEYKFVSKFLKKELTYEEMFDKLLIASKQYARRQMSWFRRWQKQGREIHWLKDGAQADELINKFI